MASSSPSRLPYTLVGFLPTLLWGTAVGLAGSLAPSIGPLKAAGISYLIAGTLAILLFRLRGNLRTRMSALQLKPFLLCFIFFAMNLAAFWLSMGSAPSKSELPELGLINYLWPTTTLLFAPLLLKQRVSWEFLPGVGLAAVGVIIPIADFKAISFGTLFSHATQHPGPYWLALMAAVTWGIYSNLTRKWEASLNAVAPPLYLLISGAVLLTAGILDGEVSHWHTRPIAELIFLGVTDAIAFIAWDAGMRKGDQTLVAAIANFTPLISTTFSLLYLDIHSDPSLWLGCFMVVAGTFLAKRSSRLKDPTW